VSQTLDLPVLPLTDQTVLPGMVVSIELDDAARAVLDTARTASDSRVLLVPRLADRYATHGVVASLEQLGRTQRGSQGAVLRAGDRARIGGGVSGAGTALWVQAELVEASPATGRARELAREYRALVVAVLQRRNAFQLIDSVESVQDPSELADLAGWASYLTPAQKRQVLETADAEARLSALIGWTRDHLAEVEVEDKIRQDVQEGVDKGQREYLLRQQLAAIRKELGDDATEGSQDYRARVEAATLPETVRTAALREVGKLERAGEQSPESGWIRTWLDTVLELPWGVTATDEVDLSLAREVLDSDHHGLDDVKERILEYLAVRARRAERGLAVVGGRGSGAVLALVGPPGVGKTSLGESVARSMGRPFVRVALGGVRDEAEIRGHRRTYVGALPGRIVRALTEAKSMNPVVLLDEVDKLGADYRGDPAAALLEVLDPAQNHTFRDHYLDFDLDLSDVVFLATANSLETIPGPLLDRMELVTLDGYPEQDKLVIARQHLLPRQLERAALTSEDVALTDDALLLIASDHTREAGVRQLERAIAKILRKATVRLAGESARPLIVGVDQLTDYLGRARFTPETHERTSVPGVATGLAVTGTGGDVLYIEATVTGAPVIGAGGTGTVVTGAGAGAGDRGLMLTGQLGEVMKESAQIALSYLRSHGQQLGVDATVLDGRVHLHVPAGAVPKDGPSAGVTMVTALASLATGRPVRDDVAMTGEVTLNGRVLPIGGVRQKLLAVQRARLSTVFLPARNAPDLDDVPAEVKEGLDIRLVSDVADIVRQALAPVADAVPEVWQVPAAA